MERSRLRRLATEPGSGRAWTIPSKMSTTWATAWVRDDPVMIQTPSVIFEGFCDSSRKPHGSPVSSSLFRSTGRSTEVVLI